jgi:HD-GYP domain-containing protein (c-di-GMP phosphodiesterase class II)
MRLVPIELAKEGHYLAKTLFDDDGRVLLREGVILNDRFITRIRDMGIYSIYINDEYSAAEIEDVIKPELRQKSVRIIKETFSSLEKYNLYTVNNPSKNKNDNIKEREKYFHTIGSIAQDIIDDLIAQKNIMINLVDIKSQDNYTYQHCVNVAVLSLVLGIQMQLDRFQLNNLCIGALMHDVGKVFIDDNILKKNGKLTSEEFEAVKMHTSKGYDYLKGILDISPVSRIIALQHHERLDGSGYPEGKKGPEINKLARIVAIADVYDALTSDRPHRRAMSPNEAVEYILGSGQTLFDYEMVKAFSEAIVPYPEGTLVKLNTNDIAVVEQFSPHFPLRPIVKIVKSNHEQFIGKKINLMHHLQIVIQGVAYTVDD